MLCTKIYWCSKLIEYDMVRYLLLLLKMFIKMITNWESRHNGHEGHKFPSDFSLLFPDVFHKIYKTDNLKLLLIMNRLFLSLSFVFLSCVYIIKGNLDILRAVLSVGHLTCSQTNDVLKDFAIELISVEFLVLG